MENDKPRILTTFEQMSSCLKNFIEGKSELNRRDTFQYVYTASRVENLKKVQYYNDVKKLKKKNKNKNKAATYKETDSVSCLDAPDVDLEGGKHRNRANFRSTSCNMASNIKLINKTATSLKFDLKNFDKNLTNSDGKTSQQNKQNDELCNALNGLWLFWTAKKRWQWLKYEKILENSRARQETEIENEQKKLCEQMHKKLTSLYDQTYNDLPNYRERIPILPFSSYAKLKFTGISRKSRFSNRKRKKEKGKSNRSKVLSVSLSSLSVQKKTKRTRKTKISKKSGQNSTKSIKTKQKSTKSSTSRKKETSNIKNNKEIKTKVKENSKTIRKSSDSSINLKNNLLKNKTTKDSANLSSKDKKSKTSPKSFKDKKCKELKLSLKSKNTKSDSRKTKSDVALKSESKNLVINKKATGDKRSKNDKKDKNESIGKFDSRNSIQKKKISIKKKSSSRKK